MKELILEISNFISTNFYNIFEIFSENPLAQSIGFLGFIISMLTFLSKQDKTFMWRMTGASFVWAIHFLLLGALSAGFLNAIDVVKNLLAIRYPFHKGIAVAVLIVYVMVGIFFFITTESITNLLPVAGSIAGTIIIFTLKGLWMRVAFLFVLMGWFVYNYTNHSIGGVTTDVILFITGVFGIYNMRKEELKNIKNIKNEKI